MMMVDSVERLLLVELKYKSLKVLGRRFDGFDRLGARVCS